MRIYSGIFSDKKEFVVEVEEKRSARNSFFTRLICEKIIRESGIKTYRKHPEKISFELFSVSIEKGEIKRTSLGMQDIIPPLEDMTESECNSTIELILTGIPENFHGFIKKYAWEYGHQYGFEDIVEHAERMSNDLKICIE